MISVDNREHLKLIATQAEILKKLIKETMTTEEAKVRAPYDFIPMKEAMEGVNLNDIVNAQLGNIHKVVHPWLNSVAPYLPSNRTIPFNLIDPTSDAQLFNNAISYLRSKFPAIRSSIGLHIKADLQEVRVRLDKAQLIRGGQIKRSEVFRDVAPYPATGVISIDLPRNYKLLVTASVSLNFVGFCNVPQPEYVARLKGTVSVLNSILKSTNYALGRNTFFKNPNGSKMAVILTDEHLSVLMHNCDKYRVQLQLKLKERGIKC